MLEADKVFAGSIPENYDRYMVPLIFEPFAVDLARRAASFSPGAVLETAAGTGVVTRTLAPRLSPDASYVATDLNQPMVDYAAAQQPPGSRIEWRQADALALPFDPGNNEEHPVNGVLFIGMKDDRKPQRRGATGY